MRIWIRNAQNCTKTSEEVEKFFKRSVPPSTIMRWRDQYDWEARAAVFDNELRRIMRHSSDPELRALAMDDINTAKMLKQLERIMQLVLKRPKKYGIMPKNIREVIAVAQYAREERERILSPARKEAREDEARSNTNITFVDRRKQEIKVGIDALPPAERNMVINQLGKSLGQGRKALESIREDAFAEDDPS